MKYLFLPFLISFLWNVASSTEDSKHWNETFPKIFILLDLLNWRFNKPSTSEKQWLDYETVPVNWSTKKSAQQWHSDSLVYPTALLSLCSFCVHVVAAKTVIYLNANETIECKFKMTTNEWSLKPLKLHNTMLQVSQGRKESGIWKAIP